MSGVLGEPSGQHVGPVDLYGDEALTPVAMSGAEIR